MAVTVGLLHPGAMGAALAAVLVDAGTDVRWASRGRSEATRRRAVTAGAVDAGTLEALCRVSDVVLSVCPPAAAEAVAEAVAGSGFNGCYVDANAVAPARMWRIAAAMELAGASTVDGCVIGPVPRRAGSTRLYLAGPQAGRVAALFAAGPVEAVVMREPVGSASALKMAYAAVSKGSDALRAVALAMAAGYGLRGALEREWDRRRPGHAEAVVADLERGGGRAWRWSGEMQEIADTAAGIGLPDGFHRAAAQVFARWSAFRDSEVPIDRLLAALPSPADATDSGNEEG